MIPNRIFIAAFGVALVALAVYHAVASTTGAGGVVLPAIGGLFLINLASRRRRHGMCVRSHVPAAPEAPVA